MTNEEKAREIALDAKERGFGATEAYCAAMEMAEWKDQQMCKREIKLKEWVELIRQGVEKLSTYEFERTRQGIAELSDYEMVMPKWKKAKFDSTQKVRICLSSEDMPFPHLTNHIKKGEWYLDFDELEKLPKEEE